MEIRAPLVSTVMPAKARARSVSPTFMATNTRARKEDNAEDDVAADDDAILGKYMAIAASGHANHPETTEAETAPKKEHNATVSYNASLSSRLSVVADPNSTVYKQLTTEEVDTLLSRPRWREFAFNLLARGLVVYKKQTNMVYVFDHEGDIVSHATFESVSTFLRGRPVPVVPVAGSTVAHRAAISVRSSSRSTQRVQHNARTTSGPPTAVACSLLLLFNTTRYTLRTPKHRSHLSLHVSPSGTRSRRCGRHTS